MEEYGSTLGALASPRRSRAWSRVRSWFATLEDAGETSRPRSAILWTFSFTSGVQRHTWRWQVSSQMKEIPTTMRHSGP